MKKKNGFTIVELIIVIGLLVVIAGLFSVNMIKVMNKNKNDEIENVKRQVIAAADAYVTMDPSSIQKLYDGFSFVEIEVKTLRKYGLINDDLKDPETGKPISDDKKIRVSVGQNGELIFEYDPNTDIEGWDLFVPDLSLTIGEQTEYTDEDALNDLRTKVVLINSDSQVPKEEDYQKITVEYNNVNVNRVGQYRITYKFHDPSMDIYKMKDRRVFVKLPPEVEYTVNHYFMNPDGVTYTKKEEYTKKGKASYGTSITPEIIETIGFITPERQSITLLQTNNIIDYYYDRKSYNVTIDPNGGSYNGSVDVTNVKVLYGNSYILKYPSRSGYEFMGWYINKDMTGGTPITNETFYRQNGKTIYARWYESFTVTSDNREMVGYTGIEDEKLVIPSTFENGGIWYKVIGIKYKAFKSCSQLKSVTIPNSVTHIGYDAFDSCSSLTSITIPDSVTRIEGGTFGSCTNLTSITIPGRVTDIGDYTFLRCTSLTSITIPYGVKRIGVNAFDSCRSLTSVKIPSSVTSIEAEAFSWCSSLTSITIPNSVKKIGKEAFWNCSKLTSINIPNSVTSIGNNAFSQCSSLTSITIPNSVTSIGSSAFSWCSSLTSINVDENNRAYKSINGVLFTKDEKTIVKYPARKSDNSYAILDSVTSIANHAFDSCSSLASITIPDGVTNIGSSAFSDCDSLTSITIPDNVTSIGSSAFWGCSSLTSVTMPESVTNIGNGAFLRCISLTSITIPDSVTSIGNEAFYGCSSLTSITIPSNVINIGDGAFYDCSNLSSVVYKGRKYTSKSTFTTAFATTSDNTIGNNVFKNTKMTS